MVIYCESLSQVILMRAADSATAILCREHIVVLLYGDPELPLELSRDSWKRVAGVVLLC